MNDTKKIIFALVGSIMLSTVIIVVTQPKPLSESDLSQMFEKSFKIFDNLGGVPQVPSYTSASSTVYTTGDDISTQVLAAKGGRGYASICNNTGQEMFIVFEATPVTATTSSDILVSDNTCYQINQDNLYTGVVQVINLTSTTTNGVLVTEFIGS